MSVAREDAPESRGQRALELFHRRGHEIRHLYGSTYRVPSQDGERAYRVEYGQREYCSCADHRYRGVSRVHLYALGIAIAKRAIRHPELAAGDPFIAVDQNRPHVCDDGWITLGQLVVDPETGEETEEYALYLCHRCAERS